MEPPLVQALHNQGMRNVLEGLLFLRTAQPSDLPSSVTRSLQERFHQFDHWHTNSLEMDLGCWQNLKSHVDVVKDWVEHIWTHKAGHIATSNTM